ncbi:MAG: hypothetical protein FRX49_10949 [Trebouxia sp. A1-2]|nr:MAG: hypothetical protein FRX49_10949 [Trebouxia sp. A1-2]
MPPPLLLVALRTRSKVAEKMATACDLTSMVTPELVCSSFYAVVAGITPEYVATCTLSRSLGYFADANAHMYKQQHFLQVINANAEVLKLAVGYLSPATYGRAEDFMTASLSSEALQGLAVDLSETEVGQRGQQTSDLLGAKKESKLVGRIHTNLHYTLDWYHGAPLSAA